jgi:hypothetical protein
MKYNCAIFFLTTLLVLKRCVSDNERHEYPGWLFT